MAMTAVLLTLALQAAAAPRAFAVAGQIQMADGSPAAAVRVAAIPAPPPNILVAQGQNYYATQLPVSVTLSGPDGRYRLGNVPPGRVFIIAGLVGSGTFHPSTTEFDAATVLTVADRDLDRIDIRLLTSPGARVSGRVTPPPVKGAREWATLAGVKLGELLEVAVGDDGAFQFGRVPRGEYLLSIFPTPPGQRSLPFVVADQDISSLQMTRPLVRRVTGRIVVDAGPLPAALLAFHTPQSHVSGSIRADGTFEVELHAGRHFVDLSGMPIGYVVRSVRVGSVDVTTTGIEVNTAEVPDVTVTVVAPRVLPTLRGRIAVAPGAPAPALTVEATGRIVGSIQAPVGPDGSFGLGPLPPGLYRLRVIDRPDVAAVQVVVDSAGGDVTIQLPK